MEFFNFLYMFIIIVPIMAAFLLMIFKKENLQKFTFFSALYFMLFYNTVGLVMLVIYNTNYIDSLLCSSIDTLTFAEIIIFGSILSSWILNNENRGSKIKTLHQTLLLILSASLVGFINFTNLIGKLSLFITGFIILVFSFFLDNKYIDHREIKKFLAIFTVSLLLLFCAIILLFIQYKTYSMIGLSALFSNDLISVISLIFLIIGLFLPIGFLFTTSYHLKSYFRNNTFHGLINYALFAFVCIFVVIQFLDFSNFDNSFIFLLFMALAALTTIYVLISLYKQMFLSIEKYSLSITEFFGYIISLDLNLIILLSFFLKILNFPFSEYYREILILRLLFTYSLLPLSKVASEDIFSTPAQNWRFIKRYGLFLLITGFLLIYPFSYSLIEPALSFILVSTSSLLRFLSYIALIIFLIYIITNLAIITIILVRYFLNKQKIEKKEDSIKPFYRKYEPVFFMLLIFLISLYISRILLVNIIIVVDIIIAMIIFTAYLLYLINADQKEN